MISCAVSVENALDGEAIDLFLGVSRYDFYRIQPPVSMGRKMELR